MGADVLATQGARASAIMIFTMLNRINSVPARQGLMELHYFTPEATQAARWRARQFRAVCMGFTANTIFADGLAILEARASAVILLIPKARVFLLQHQKS